MESFAHLTVFLSLIYGMAVAQILFGFAQLINSEHRVQWYVAQIVWALAVLIVTATWWWLEFSWSRESQIRFGDYLFLVVKPCILYLMGVLLFPRIGDSGVIDTRAHYWHRSRWIVALAVGFVALELVDSVIRNSILALNPVYFLAIIGAPALLASGWFVRKTAYHVALAGLILGLMIFSLIVEGEV